MSKLIDTHFHLDFYKNHKEIYKQINDLGQYTLCVTNSPEVYLSCTKLYKETKYLKFAVGYNPKTIYEQPFDKTLFTYALKTSSYIGEVGLDFSRKYYSARELQIKIFSQIAEIASKENKLLSIHSFMAEKDVLNILEKNRVENSIVHWYSGDKNLIKRFIDLGCYFSINNKMVETPNGCAIVNEIPLGRILIESDGPFTFVKGRKFGPSLLNTSYELIADELKLKNLRDIVYDNFKGLLEKYAKIDN